ncbi:MAG TPA: hypothetical protein PK358_01850 [Spirochaetota bacterium]|nr:hypothetical protein [Spirochaetota bacterium]HPJ33547.1 hypothetical protein [Spirochaetota bacterium]
MKKINPDDFGLHRSTELVQADNKKYYLIINRKSRFIQKDAEKTFEKIEKIKSIKPGVEVALKISGPLCSKAKAFLEERGIEVIRNIPFTKNNS